MQKKIKPISTDTIAKIVVDTSKRFCPILQLTRDKEEPYLMHMTFTICLNDIIYDCSNKKTLLKGLEKVFKEINSLHV